MTRSRFVLISGALALLVIGILLVATGNRGLGLFLIGVSFGLLIGLASA